MVVNVKMQTIFVNFAKNYKKEQPTAVTGPSVCTLLVTGQHVTHKLAHPVILQMSQVNNN